jgi:hypothetical protein
MAHFSRQEIVKQLTEGGDAIQDYFLLGHAPCTWNADLGCPMVHVIEIDDLAEECTAFLRSSGTPAFDTPQQLHAHAKAHLWTNWERWQVSGVTDT